jgi:hypothetical protein
MVLIRSGITRTVWLVGRYAVKVPSLRRYGDGLSGALWSLCRGVLANQAEATWWRNSHNPNLCPVLHSWLGGIINIYPRCTPYEVTPAVEQAMFHRETRALPELDPWPGDEKPDNYGWLPTADGPRLVRVDYDMNYNGCPHDRSGAFNRAEQDKTA